MATDLQNLSKIFNNRIFRIPDYQRGYAWGERQLADFWADLERVNLDRTHYCGQLTLEKVANDEWKQWGGDAWLVDDAAFDPYFIVDGQQRLTTAVVLIHCLLEQLEPDEVIAGLKVSELKDRYLTKANGVLKSCLFGYAKDNPSHEFFRTQVLGVPSNEYNGARTTYTANLGAALAFFRERVPTPNKLAERERIFKALTQRFRFNLHELNDDIDVFVAFETMNNRGKPLSRLELLKNRLIYLSTLAKGSDSEKRKVRDAVNQVWRTVYEELGKNPDKSLEDDDFLRAHWILFFGYDKEEADPLTQFLLNNHFTTARLDSGELTLEDIQKYADSLQLCARKWQAIHFPRENQQVLGEKAAAALLRLGRLSFGSLRPLLLSILAKNPSEIELQEILSQAERFLLLIRSWAGKRSDIAEADSFRMAHDIHRGIEKPVSAGHMLRDRVSKHFQTSAFQQRIDDLFTDGKGFYQLPGIAFFLFEYEEHLRRMAKSSGSKIVWNDFKGSAISIEHVYPQTPESVSWILFDRFSSEQKDVLKNTLGNLVAVSVAKNASLSRKSFAEKKVGNEKIPGYSQGSFSELEIAQLPEWAPQDILRRGIKLLEFIESHWDIGLGDIVAKKKLLKLDFLPN